MMKHCITAEGCAEADCSVSCASATHPRHVALWGRANSRRGGRGYDSRARRVRQRLRPARHSLSIYSGGGCAHCTVHVSAAGDNPAPSDARRAGGRWAANARAWVGHAALATGAAFALARPPPPQWPAARRPSSTSSCCPMAHVTAAMLKTCIPPLVVPRR